MNDISHAREALPAAGPATPLLDVSELTVTFDTDAGPIPAVRGVDLSLAAGEIVGLVGESGSGKSVTCQALLGLLSPSASVSGRLRVAGSEVSARDAKAFARLRGQTLSMIFQDPMSALDPLMTIRRHLRQRLKRHDVDARDDARARELLRRAGIADVDRVLAAYPHQLSGGLCQRAVIALALAGAPKFLVADEPTTALDVTIQAQVLDLLAELRQSDGLAVILISHDLGVVAEVCDRIAVMYAGQIVEQGPVHQVLRSPLHPYTRGLIASRPSLTGPRSSLQAIPGAAPAPGKIPPGCAFAPRCPQRTDACERTPAYRTGASGAGARCHHPLRHA